MCGEGEGVAPNPPRFDAFSPADADLLQEAAADAVTDVDLLDLHVRPVLDEEVDRVDAVVERLVIAARLLAGAVGAGRVRVAGTVHARLARLIIHAGAHLEERP